MTTRSSTLEVLEKEVAPSMPSVGGGSVDVQVATGKKFPRSITGFMRRATEMATLTPEIAESCVYAIPRDGKTVEGPSARLAEIVAHAFGNMRIQAAVTDQDDRFVTARGEAWDVETNVAIGFEVKRRITDRKGKTYTDDMITVTGNAAASIALRNAVLKAVPTSFWKPIYNECRKVIAGDARTFATRQDEMFKKFAVMGVTEQRLCAALGIKGKADVSLDHMVTLTGFYNALKEGETTIEEAFPDGGGLGTPQAAQRKSQQPAAATTVSAPTPNTPAPGAPAKPSTESPSSTGAVVDVIERENGVIAVLSNGFRASSRDVDLIAGLKQLKGSGVLVELVTRPSSDPTRYAPTLEEIVPAEREAGGDDA